MLWIIRGGIDDARAGGDHVQLIVLIQLQLREGRGGRAWRSVRRPRKPGRVGDPARGFREAESDWRTSSWLAMRLPSTGAARRHVRSLSPEASDEILVDARGHRCPTPTFDSAPALSARLWGAGRLLADDPMAKIDVPHFAGQQGLELLEGGGGGVQLPREEA